LGRELKETYGKKGPAQEGAKFKTEKIIRFTRKSPRARARQAAHGGREEGKNEGRVEQERN